MKRPKKIWVLHQTPVTDEPWPELQQLIDRMIDDYREWHARARAFECGSKLV